MMINAYTARRPAPRDYASQAEFRVIHFRCKQH